MIRIWCTVDISHSHDERITEYIKIEQCHLNCVFISQFLEREASQGETQGGPSVRIVFQLTRESVRDENKRFIALETFGQNEHTTTTLAVTRKQSCTHRLRLAGHWYAAYIPGRAR